MKRLVFVLIAFCSVRAFAFDLRAIEESRTTLVAALNGVVEDGTGAAQYIPNYGLHIAIREFLEPSPKKDVLTLLPNLVAALADTIKGLNQGDWVSVAYKNDEPKYEVLVRVKPRQPDTLEVWIDGKRQPATPAN